MAMRYLQVVCLVYCGRLGSSRQGDFPGAGSKAERGVGADQISAIVDATDQLVSGCCTAPGAVDDQLAGCDGGGGPGDCADGQGAGGGCGCHRERDSIPASGVASA